jgi:hypothetical protein
MAQSISILPYKLLADKLSVKVRSLESNDVVIVSKTKWRNFSILSKSTEIYYTNDVAVEIGINWDSFTHSLTFSCSVQLVAVNYATGQE